MFLDSTLVSHGKTLGPFDDNFTLIVHSVVFLRNVAQPAMTKTLGLMKRALKLALADSPQRPASALPSPYLPPSAYKCGSPASLPNYTAEDLEPPEPQRGLALKPPIPFDHHEIRPTDSLARCSRTNPSLQTQRYRYRLDPFESNAHQLCFVGRVLICFRISPAKWPTVCAIFDGRNFAQHLL